MREEVGWHAEDTTCALSWACPPMEALRRDDPSPLFLVAGLARTLFEAASLAPRPQQPTPNRTDTGPKSVSFLLAVVGDL